MELDLELEWELEWELELKWELEWELVLKPRNPREFQPGAQKSALWAKMALLSIFVNENGPLEPFLEPLSKLENVLFARGGPLYDPVFNPGFSLKVHFQGTLWYQSTALPPHFHRFRSY